MACSSTAGSGFTVLGLTGSLSNDTLGFSGGYIDIVSNAVPFNGLGTWGGTTASWSSSTNWTDANNTHGVPGDGTRRPGTDTATFSGSGSTAITLDVSPSLAGLSFSGTNYTLMGGSLTLNSSMGTATVLVTSSTQTIDSALVLATSSSFQPDSTSVLKLSGQISGTGALALDGPGELVLSGTNNSFSGGAVVNEGTLIVNNSGALLDGSSLTVGAGGTFIFDPTVAGSPAMGLSRDSIVPASAAVAAVPEPGTLVLLIAGLVMGLGVWQRKRRIRRGFA